ncbi:MAG: pyruvate dehydrogenase (acetyl-transferring), homodimeric type [Calditrichaeota bacterium]|nr:pyruvate dehydrogenase (acetyl-transferring), homodimeric type [Calditrichota bacterium]
MIGSNGDIDQAETREWLEALQQIIEIRGPERARFLLGQLMQATYNQGLQLPFFPNTPYINTIPAAEQPKYPGDRPLERRIKSIIRWNAMAMVVRANTKFPGIGGHISTFASSASLYEVGFNHFFRGKGAGFDGDLIYMQGHGSPGIYARAFVEGRISLDKVLAFRRELEKTGGLSSYPHPWLMPDFWEFPTVSMGLGPISAIYQARFARYLADRGIKDTTGQHIWAFLGDGETDEPESLGAISLAAREGLSNLIFVVNCNLQRLDGPVRGNGKIIQELETVFRGAGWNVVKVLWGDDWDPLFQADKGGYLIKRMEDIVDGHSQKYIVEDGAFLRSHFFGAYPELLKLVENYSDEQLKKLRLGGHDPAKIFAAYDHAVKQEDKPTVILARTIKGYGLGEAGEGKNITHNQKKLNHDEMQEFRDRFDIPLTDKQVEEAPFYRPDEKSPEIQYLRERRSSLGGFVPARRTLNEKLETPDLHLFNEFLGGSDREVSTTMAFVRMLSNIIKHPQIGRKVVPIIPDEARTFGMEFLFRQVGIYAHGGQKYEPVDADSLLYYREAKNGQILEEGITEAGSMASFTAAGTAHANYGTDMIPFFIYYSMFGFQRIGDLAWAFADQRGRGFLIGGTAGRTTLNGEGLQHQDGHSHVMAGTIPTCLPYDPAWAYEIAVIIQEGMRRMYNEREDIFYYITVCNENYSMPAMPEGCQEGILKGLYKFREMPAKPKGSRKAMLKAHIFGGGSILREALRAQEILAEKYDVAADVWSATSYVMLHRDAMETERWNMLNPTQKARKPYIAELFEKEDGPIVAASDYLKTLPNQVARFVPNSLLALGTDGFGRSETREALRRFFEVDAECITIGVLYQLAQEGKIKASVVGKAIKELGVDPEKLNPMIS